MEAVISENDILFDDNFQNMKVTELKKELKSRGLPSTGTKVELISRLQDAQLIATKESEDALDPNDSLGEEELTIDDQPSLNLISRVEKSEDEMLDVIPEVCAEPTTIQSTTLAPESQPFKKRFIVSPSNGTFVAEKKVSLNRTTSFITPPQPPTTEEPVQPEPQDDATAKLESKDIPKKITVGLKTLTANEKLQMRAKRFDVIAPTAQKEKTTGAGVSKANAQGTSAKSADIDVLKKRAERFGGNVSTVMKQIEEKEKVLKRKLRFGAAPVSSLSSTTDATERKRQRAERFKI